MTDLSNDGFVLIHKDEYIVNILAMGIAVQMLSKKIGIPMEHLTQQITDQANKQFEQLSSEQIQQMIQIYEAARNG